MNTIKSTTDNHSAKQHKSTLGLLNKTEKSKERLANELANNCLGQSNLSTAAIQLVNDMAFHLQCDRVSLGMCKGQHAEFIALSNNAHFDEKTNLIRSITNAMDESIDETSTIVFPPLNTTDSTINIAHQQLVKQQGNWSVCTIPLRFRGNYIGAICLERSAKNAIDLSILQRAETIAQLVGPFLYLLRQEQRSIVKRISDSFHHSCVQLFGQNKAPTTLALSSIIFILLFLGFYSGDYRVTANAVLEGRIQRVISAPISGYIKTAVKRAGDRVKKGELIASLDDRDLKLEAVKLKSQHQQLKGELRQSLATNDRNKISVINSRVKQVDTKLELINEQLSRLKLVAPISGMIIDGDLSQSIGSPVARGDLLYKVAPIDDYRVILKVDESEVSHIKYGQTAQLSLSSLPGDILNISVSKITPVSLSSNGSTYFRIEAQLHTNTNKLQPGMEGVGKIDIGERNLLWILTHKVTDRIRLLFWRVWL